MERLRLVLCALFGCPMVIDYCFGYVTCARCHRQHGDTLMGSFEMGGYVVKGHACAECTKLWSQLSWHEKILVGGKAKVLHDEKAEILERIRAKEPQLAETLESLDATE